MSLLQELGLFLSSHSTYATKSSHIVHIKGAIWTFVGSNLVAITWKLSSIHPKIIDLWGLLFAIIGFGLKDLESLGLV